MMLSALKRALAQVAAQDDSDLRRQRARLLKLCNLFQDLYDDGPVKLLRAPARINVLGEHIDYVSYLPTSSLTFGSRERDTLMLYRASTELRVRSASTSPNYANSSFQVEPTSDVFGGNHEPDWLSVLYKRGTPKPHWQNYVEGAISFACGKYGRQITRGFDFVVDSTIPAGGGASSSSALVVLGGATIREINGISFSNEELAHDSALAEWYIGTRGGSMDHITICQAQKSHAVLINYADKQTRRVSLPDAPYQWLTFFSQPAEKGRAVMIEYNERAAVSRLLIPALIDRWKITHPDRYQVWCEAINLLSDGSTSALDQLEELLTKLPEVIDLDVLRQDYQVTFSDVVRSFPALLEDQDRWPLRLRDRALHHLGEIRRVNLAAKILDSLTIDTSDQNEFSSLTTIGKLLDESHKSLRDLYGVSTAEVEHLIAIIRSDPNILGARLMGGGFGGNMLVLTTENHSKALIDRVQNEYYEPQQRDGVREGSVMVSTPGDGLAPLNLRDFWRAAINEINSTGPVATSYSSNLRTLLDALPVASMDNDIWPVIVAAGKGTRASASGLNVPKPVAMVANKPAILHVLENIRRGLGKTRPPLVIVSPETESSVRKALENETVQFAVQPEAHGTGDAVLHARSIMTGFDGFALVVWSTQPVIQPKTYERTHKLTQLFDDFDMIVPTTLCERPYAPIRRNEGGAVQSAQETHLEGAHQIEFGETNIGLFVLKSKIMFEVLLDLKRRYWEDGRYKRASGELGFPNELITELAQRNNGVFACSIADPREVQGIKNLEDVAKCERFISELEQERLIHVRLTERASDVRL